VSLRTDAFGARAGPDALGTCAATEDSQSSVAVHEANALAARTVQDGTAAQNAIDELNPNRS